MGLTSLLSGAVSFQAKHPVLKGVTIILLALPAFMDHAMRRLLAVEDPLFVSDAPAWQQPILLGTLLVMLLTTILELWGIACILVTARRLLGHPAGRTRRVLRSLMREGADYVPALLLTSILRTCTVALLLLPSLLIAILLLWKGIAPEVSLTLAAVAAVPGVLYSLKTIFYSVVIVGEHMSYRAALRRSAEALKGRMLPVATRLLLLLAVTLGPAIALDELLVLHIPSEEFSARALGADAAISVVEGIGILLCTVAITLLYTNLRPYTVRQATAGTTKRKPTKRAKR